MERSVSSIKYIFCIALVFALFASPASAEGKNSQYRLQSTDVVNITVHGQPDLTTKTRVGADGFISFPLIDKVEAKGLTVQELESKIKKSLEKDYLVKAEVLVFIEEYHPRQVSVIGDVNNPGKYDLPKERDVTLLEAIAMAGGFTKDASANGTKVMRTENGKKTTINVRVKDITDKGDKEKDIVLQPDDVVYVPESFF